MFRSLVSLMLFVLAFIASNQVMAGSTSPPAVTTADCKSEWDKSSASETCSLNDYWAENNQCNFSASCTYSISTGNDRGSVGIYNVAKDSVSSLIHCEPLVLQVGGSC